MRIVPSIIFTLLLLAACSGNENNIPIQKMDATENDDVIIEADTDESDFIEAVETDQFLEFMIDDEIVSISISEIPILKEYLQAQQEPQRAIAMMELEKYEVAFELFYILQFSCFEEHCSHFLLHPDKNKSAILVADLAKFETFSISPDATKIALQFSRLREKHLPLSNIVVFDLFNWTPIPLENSIEELNMLGFKWPIITLEWNDEESIAISFPDLIEPNKESWDAWSATEENSKITINYFIQAN